MRRDEEGKTSGSEKKVEGKSREEKVEERKMEWKREKRKERRM